VREELFRSDDMYMLWKIFEMFLFKGKDDKMQTVLKALKFEDPHAFPSPFVSAEELKEKETETPKQITPPNIPDRVEPPRPLLSERLRYLESVYRDT